MLYLEDYFEMIENLPMELRDRFTETRELDLQVQNLMDTLSDREKQFFRKLHLSGDSVKQEWKDEHFNKIKEEYNTAVEYADEKVQTVNQVYDLVERHVRKLDQELEKFKMELEADNPGITSVLEKRSLDLDNPSKPNGIRVEKRMKYSMPAVTSISGNIGGITLQHDIKQPNRLSSIIAQSPIDSRSNSISDSLSMFPASSSGYTFSVPSSNKAPLVAAAQKAIALTSETAMGRRTSSLKASYDGYVVKGNVGNISQSPPQNFTSTTISGQHITTSGNSIGSHKKSSKKIRSMGGIQVKTSIGMDPSNNSGLNINLNPTNTPDWNPDPNEPRYCLCNEISYGEMIGCDNQDCPIEWFHYPCVGLNTAPKGKWYCPQCTVTMKRRGRRN